MNKNTIISDSFNNQDAAGLVFGPVPSRRLGQSLGINNIPPKTCSYSCIYCQVGATTSSRDRQCAFFNPRLIYKSVEQKVKAVRNRGEHIDYVAFVSQGEPTLDLNLGKSLKLLSELKIKTAVISNASLIGDPRVQSALLHADLVSLKFDTVVESLWKQVNRPHGRLNLDSILEGAMQFRKRYKGSLITETMLIKDYTDDENSIEKTAIFLKHLNPSCAYLTTPTRPPLNTALRAPERPDVIHIYRRFQDQLKQIYLLPDDEGNSFTFAGELKEEILSTTAVHPIRFEALESLVREAGASWNLVTDLISADELEIIVHNDEIFYVRHHGNAQ